MRSEKFSELLIKFSLFFLVISLIIFSYSFFKYNSFSSEKENFEILKKELNEINASAQNNSKMLVEKNKFLNDKSVAFLTTYGFDYLKEDDQLIQEEVKKINDENSQIKSSIKEELKKYINYFEGEYYELEDFSGIVAKVTTIDDRDISEQLNPNIYDDINLEPFIEQAKKSGTIGYLSSINVNNKFNNVLFFLTAMYSDNLYEISHDMTDIPDNLTSVYNNIITTQQIFRVLEDFGLNTGSLKSENLDELISTINSLVKKYYENQAITEKLTGESYEKSE